MNNNQHWTTTHQTAGHQQPLPVRVPVQIPPPLPPGWISVIDPVSGRTYYANSSTGQTSWEPPLLPPPPQLLPQSHIVPPSELLPQQQQLQQQPQQHSQYKNMGIDNVSNHHMNNTNMSSITTIQPTAITTTTTTLTGNIAHISTLQAAGLFIPSVRATIRNSTIDMDDNEPQNQQQQQSNDNTKRPNLEFAELSGGIIADLASVQRNYRFQQSTERNGGEEDEEEKLEEEKKRLYYEPLKPLELPISSKAPHIEPGRVDIRIMSLMDALGRI